MACMGSPGVLCGGIDVAGRRSRQEALLEVKAHAVYSCEWRGTEECTLIIIIMATVSTDGRHRS